MKVHRLMCMSGALLMMAAATAAAQVAERRSGSRLDVLRRTIEQAEAERAAEESRRAAEQAQPRRDVPTRNERDSYEPYRHDQSDVAHGRYEQRGSSRGGGWYDDRYDHRGASLSDLFRGIRLNSRQEREVDAIARGYRQDVQRLRTHHRRRGELGSRQHRRAEDRLEWRFHDDLRSVLDSRQRRTFDRNLSRAGYDSRWDDRRW